MATVECRTNEEQADLSQVQLRAEHALPKQFNNRIIDTFNDGELVVLVVRFGHRRDIGKN